MKKKRLYNVYVNISSILLEHPEVPGRMGTINNAEKFDAEFFGISFEQAHTFSPEIRLLLEYTYEAVIDAGFNPKQMRGKNTAVIIASCYVETQFKMLYEDLQVQKIDN